MEVLNQICREHGIEPLAPEKSRGTLEVAEYKKQRHKANELAEQNAQADAELAEKKAAIESAEKKTAKLVKIDSIEVKKLVFGKKVTLFEEDYNNLVVLAQKQVVSVKDTKKLKTERKTILQKIADIESALESSTSELTVYKKKEAEKGLFSRKQLNAESKRISETERLKTSLRKALTVIDTHGLRSEYEHIKLNTAQKKTVLE